ncbi:MAG TPA: hypothetical protein IAA95_08860 [Candidatus Aveggerthella excrementigallinarum]|nr:hypothetical protein [Candidatus Aveggerthella excrementigallinarum]
MARNHANSNENQTSSSWQPVQPTSHEERVRYRQRQFTPIIGSVVETGNDFRTSARPAQSAATSPASSTGHSWAPSRATAQAEAARSGSAPSKTLRPRPSRRSAAKKAAHRTPPTSPSARPRAASSSAGTGHALAAAIMGALAILVAPSSWFFAFVLAAIALAQASKAKKLGTRAAVGRAIGVLGIVAAALALVASGFAGLDDLFDGRSYLQPVESYEDATDASDEVLGMFSTNGSEARVEELARAQFDKLTNPDEDTIDRVAAQLDAYMQEVYGFTHADLGLDPTESARWALEGSTYSLSSVFAFDDDKEGSAYADVTVRDISSLDAALWDAVSSVDSRTLEELRNNPADLEVVASAYRDVLQSTPEMKDRFVDIQFKLEDGEWVLDEDYWDKTLDNLYHL